MENRRTLLDRLLAYGRSGIYPFHMPGHKRRMPGHPLEAAYGIDITEIEGFDELHHAEGILKQEQQRAARVFGSEQTCFLVNGSTCGVLAAVCAAAQKGQKLLLARGCHKSVYDAALLQELKTVYLYPGWLKEADVWRGLTAEEVASALDREPDTAAAVITSPTYEGVVSDIRGIAEAVHKRGIPLIVDAAHGAHFGFHPEFPESPVAQGADIVIQSLHKTLPAFTQTALLHVNGAYTDRLRLERYLELFQSSSPSYLLMSGITECVRLLEEQGSHLWDTMFTSLSRFYEQMKGLRHLSVLAPEAVRHDRGQDFDMSRLVISARGGGISGKLLQERLLQEYRLQMEMAAGTYAVAIVTMNDTEEGLERLAGALLDIDGGLGLPAGGRSGSGNGKAGSANDGVRGTGQSAGQEEAARRERQEEASFRERQEDAAHRERQEEASFRERQEEAVLRERQEEASPLERQEEAVLLERQEEAVLRRLQEFRPAQALTIARAAAQAQQASSLQKAAGGICAAYLCLYPPGTPLLVPGERITQESISLLEAYLAMGYPVRGLVKEKDGGWAVPVISESTPIG